MKYCAVALCLVATNAVALDFNTEWNRIKSHFPKPKVAVVEDKLKVTPIDPVEDNKPAIMEQVDPKSPDRLGYKLQDPEMRKRVIEAYNKPNAVVYTYTIR